MMSYLSFVKIFWRYECKLNVSEFQSMNQIRVFVFTFLNDLIFLIFDIEIIFNSFRFIINFLFDCFLEFWWMKWCLVWVLSIYKIFDDMNANAMFLNFNPWIECSLVLLFEWLLMIFDNIEISFRFTNSIRFIIISFDQCFFLEFGWMKWCHIFFWVLSIYNKFCWRYECKLNVLKFQSINQFQFFVFRFLNDYCWFLILNSLFIICCWNCFNENFMIL